MPEIELLVLGFSKCGTTTLCTMLAQHRGAYITAFKKPWCFSSNGFQYCEEDYRRNFIAAPEGQQLGEGSVSYSGHEKEDISIERIMASNSGWHFVWTNRTAPKLSSQVTGKCTTARLSTAFLDSETLAQEDHARCAAMFQAAVTAVHQHCSVERIAADLESFLNTTARRK